MTPINFNHFNLSNSIVSYEDISAFEFDTKNELSGKTIDFYNFDKNNIYDILSTLVVNHGGKVISDQPIYKFAAFSDIHLSKLASDPDNVGDGNGKLDFIRGLSCAKNHDVEFACIAGDIGINVNQHLTTEILYDEAITSAGITFPISCCNGNHDTVMTKWMWKNITSCDLTYYDLRNDDKDLFFFMSLPIYPESTQELQWDPYIPYSNESLNLLSSTLRDNPGKNVFLFLHFPLNSENSIQFAGLGNFYYPGNSNYVGREQSDVVGEKTAGINYEGFQLSDLMNTELSNTEYNYSNEQNHFILETIRNYDGKVIVFHGHSHYVFEVDRDIENVIFSQIGKNAYSVHIPSLNYPRNRNRQQIVGKCPAKSPSQGYIIERYPSKLVIKGYEFNAIIDKELGDLRRTYSIDLI